MSRLVVALGGNALIHRGEPGSTEVQRHNLIGAARALVALDGLGHELVLTHGNGPQVGLMALQAAAYAPGTLGQSIARDAKWSEALIVTREERLNNSRLIVCRPLCVGDTCLSDESNPTRRRKSSTCT